MYTFVCEQQYLFVRKTALLLDTTNSLPGNMFTVLPAGTTSFPELTFSFESMEDVNNYWSQLQSIALHTDLNNLSGTAFISLCHCLCLSRFLYLCLSLSLSLSLFLFYS